MKNLLKSFNDFKLPYPHIGSLLLVFSLNHENFRCSTLSQAITCSKLTIETLEQGVK